MKLFVRKKFVALLFLITLFSFPLMTMTAQMAEQSDDSLEREVTLVPFESPPEDTENSTVEFILVNDDIDGEALTDVTYEHRLEYNVTFEIADVDKGTFDSAIILNATTVRLGASEIPYGENRTGSINITLSASPLKVKVKFRGKLTAKWKGFEGELEAETDWIEIDLQKFWSRIKDTFKKAWEWFREHFGVPEFPHGEFIALGMGILVLFAFKRRDLLFSE